MTIKACPHVLTIAVTPSQMDATKEVSRDRIKHTTYRNTCTLGFKLTSPKFMQADLYRYAD